MLTGATGFVGRNTLSYLTNDDNIEVIAVSRNNTLNIGDSAALAPHPTEERLRTSSTTYQPEFASSTFATSKLSEDIVSHIGLSTQSCDLIDRKQVESLFDRVGRVDCVIHLAGQTFKKGLSEPHTYFDSNFRSTLNILECCRSRQIQRVVLSSSIAVYGLAQGQGKPDYTPVDEKHRIQPFDFYDASKAHAEQLLEFYSARYGITGTVLRYSRIYGPGTDKAIVYGAVRNALANKRIDVFGDITSDFVYIEDIAKINLAACKRQEGFEVFNIGSGAEVSLYQLCSKIVELTGSSSELNYTKDPHARFSLDISKARNMLGYEPTLLPEGLSKTISFIRQSYGRN